MTLLVFIIPSGFDLKINAHYLSVKAVTSTVQSGSKLGVSATCCTDVNLIFIQLFIYSFYIWFETMK